MKFSITLSILCFIVYVITSGCSKKSNPSSAIPSPIVDGRTYKLVWADEFDYTGLPDPAKWGYETGFVRNNEKQYYTDARIENAYVGNGFLTIQGRKEIFGSAGYTSASVQSKGKASWKYGKIEIKAKLPKAVGSWPAIWMLGTDYPSVNDWPMCGEIDIMEAVGKDSNKIFGTMHYGSSLANHQSKGSGVNTTVVYDDFHVYAIEWTPEAVKFFMDTNNYFTFNKSDVVAGESWAFNKEFYLILNLAIGGDWGGGDNRFPPFGIDDSLFPQKMLIDYVRVYQKQ